MLDKRRLGTFVLGGIAGAVAGVLLAPKSGKELRGSISNRAGEARERGRETYFEAQERVQERLTERLERPRPVDANPVVRETAPEDHLLTGLVGQEEYAPPAGDAPPPLRDVSRDAPRDPTRNPLRDATRNAADLEGKDPDPEEIRRRIRETRSRLRARLDRPAGSPEGDAGPNEDPRGGRDG